MIKYAIYFFFALLLNKATSESETENKPSVTPPDISSHKNLHLLPTECGLVQPQNRIIGGQRAKLQEFPWMALIADENNNKIRYNCPGAVINRRYILTAGVCVEPNLQIKFVRLGELNTTSDPDCITTTEGVSNCAPPVQDIPVEKVIALPNNKDTQENIGLLRLSSDIQFNDAVSPVCLPVARTDINSPFTVAGWGSTETASSSDTLLKVQVPHVPQRSCEAIYKIFNIDIGDNEICAGETGKDSCTGDSGTPLLSLNTIDNNQTKYIQIGISTFGPIQCGLEIPSVYTNVAKYMDWILDNLES